MKNLTALIDNINEGFGRVVAYLILPMVFVVVYEVVARKIFQAPTEWGFDVTIYIYGAHFILGFGYVMFHDAHVRIDVIYNFLPSTLRDWLKVITFIIFFIPFLVALTYTAVQYAAESWEILEKGQSTWRPPLYIVKTVMPLGTALLLLQGISNFIKDCAALKGGDK